MKLFLPAVLLSIFLTGCSNYFSNYRTVYRIETTTGERYYSDSEPQFDKNKNIYFIKDLDGNKYQLEKIRVYQIEKFTHKK